MSFTRATQATGNEFPIMFYDNKSPNSSWIREKKKPRIEMRGAELRTALFVYVDRYGFEKEITNVLQAIALDREIVKLYLAEVENDQVLIDAFHKRIDDLAYQK